ncbi:MAG: hypothetical protein J6I73_01310 [Treponema sp.]|nr:hypothetical protein [Treponema sp.]
MKQTTRFIMAMLIALAAAPLAAQEGVSGDFAEESPWDFSLTTDFVYYPKTDFVAGQTHFAPTTGAFDSIEARITAFIDYTVKIPFSDHPLVKGNTLVFEYALELTPISIMPKFKLSFTPIAFLVFSAGVNTGTGWPFPAISVQGMAKLVDTSASSGWDAYENLTPFKQFYIDTYVSGTFQFDVGALWPGDWHHIVMLATYKTGYIALTGMHDREVWKWQGGGNKTNGWQYEANFVLGYQMPIVLSMVGLNIELAGHYSSTDYTNAAYKGNFMTVNIAPLARFKFNEHHMLTTLAYFANRRSFAEGHTSSHQETELTYAGSEWYFRRIVLSYTYSF